MPMNPQTMAAEIEKFAVPAEEDPQSEPPGLDGSRTGWPDGVDLAPDPVIGQSTGESAGPTQIVADLGPDVIGGYLVAPPYWEGAEILAVAGQVVTVGQSAANPQGAQTAEVLATASEQSVFELPGSPSVQAVAVVRQGDGALLAVDSENSELDLGVVAVHPPDPQSNSPIAVGDVLVFTYSLTYGGTIPAGTAWTALPPKGEPQTARYSVGDAWSEAYTAMVYEGAANGVPPAEGTLGGAQAAMKAVVDGMMGFPGMGALALQTGALAFWGVCAGSATTIWPGSLAAVPPATIAGMSAAVTLAGVSSIALGPNALIPWSRAIPRAVAALLAGAVYTTSQGALVVFQPGPSPVPFPFL